ncbi:DNA (cytosine-5-)-methyltransferase [Eggerthellaceae bacterium zg-893]|nr:DNA (cytosine-5-)-methyltransferase [Eggerthellaceae bacterium zg-893]
MTYLSLFSGIEAASVAWEPVGFRPLAFAETDPFCCSLLSQRWPEVPNLGDVREVDFRGYRGRADVVVGGSPCQSFSRAGGGEGLRGKSGLMLEFVRAVAEARPRWVVWENVPGALSVEQGRAFGCLLRELDELGYGLAWRVLDAQAFGVPQRRRRVYLVGFGHGAGRACEVLLERRPDSRDLLSGAEPGERAAVGAGDRSKGGAEPSGPDDVMCFEKSGVTRPDCGANPLWGLPAYTLTASGERLHVVTGDYRVRRLTPTECERLMGFPDGHTLVEHRGRPAADDPRYRALGNSMAVPVMRWIGERIAKADRPGPVTALRRIVRRW